MTSANAPAQSRHRWLLLLIAAPAAVAVWSGWVGLGQKCGFGPVHPLPGIDDGFRLNTAITLPVGMEAYGAYALGVWLGPDGVPDRARSFAKRSAIGALGLGMLGQVVYHLLVAAGWLMAPWPVVVFVSCLPVATLGLGAALTHMMRATEATDPEPEATGEAIPDATPEPQVDDAPDASDDAIWDAMEEAIQEAIDEPSGQAIDEPAREPDGTPAGDAIDEPPAEATKEATPEAMPVPEAMPPREPEDATPEEPPVPVARLVDDPDATAARAAYRRSMRTGRPLSDRALGTQFGRGRTWGANRIKEVKGGPALAKAQ